MAESENEGSARVKLVTPMAGETIYSVCARSHCFSGNIDPRSTSMALLGHPRGSVHHDVPFGLAQLSAASDGVVDGSDMCLRERTVLGAYMPFMSAAERQRVRLACGSSAGGPLSTIRAHFSWQVSRAHELRFCAACLEEDRRERGFSFWRMALQLPGAWVCLRHRLALNFVPSRPKKDLEWLTVDDSESMSKPVSLPSPQLYFVEKVTKCITWLAGLERVDADVLAATVRLRMHQEGLLRNELKGCVEEFTAIGKEFFQPLSQAGVSGFESCASTRWLAETLIDRRSTHPVRWALLLAVAGEVAPSSLQREYIEASARLPVPQLFAGPSRRRSRAPDAVYAALDGPITLADASKALGVQLPELERWLRRDPQLGRHWKKRAFEVKSGAAKFTVEGYLREHPQATRMETINSCRWAVRLLDRVDPGYVQALLPQGTTTRTRQLRLFPD